MFRMVPMKVYEEKDEKKNEINFFRFPIFQNQE